MFFLDEMGVGLNLSPLYRRAPLGQRVYDEQPAAKGKRVSPHKVPEVREVIEKTGATIVYLPPYHPDLNPIELAWNKMKQH